ncbi:MAG: rhomboid family intramembrane serine protease [Spirochaetes bacterium]|nr:rhomboid family intramembrane serine protease [Spirochaetota bacterium]
MKNDISFNRPVSSIICIINLIIFAFTLILLNTKSDIALAFFRNFTLVPSLIFSELKIWQFVTYMFITNPSSIIYALIHIFILTSFSITLEDIMGSYRFLVYFFVCGISSGICVFIICLITGTDFQVIGSEGVVIGLIFAFASYFSESTIYFNFIIPIKAKYFLVLYGIFFIILDYFPTKNIATFGQFGSIIGAYIFFKFFFNKDKARKSSIGKYAKRMQKMRETEGKSFIEKHSHPDRNTDLKKNILLHLRSNPDINSLNDDEFQFVKYIDIIIERKTEAYNSVQNLDNISDEDFINEVRYLTKI